MITQGGSYGAAGTNRTYVSINRVLLTELNIRALNYGKALRLSGPGSATDSPYGPCRQVRDFAPEGLPVCRMINKGFLKTP